MPRTTLRTTPDPERDPKGGEPQDPTQPDQEPGRDPKPVYGEEPNLRPADIHADYVRRRLEGGEPPTPDAYARAARQWRQLPGATAAAPTDLGNLPEPPPAPGDRGDEDKPPDKPGDSPPRRPAGDSAKGGAR